MAEQKHLKDLLEEAQEPFQLHSYVASKKSQFKSQIQPHKPKPKPKPISKNAAFRPNFCKNACFFSLTDSPVKSPLFDFPKSPCKSPNKVFLHVPSRTATKLLEAAMKIQNHPKPKPKTQFKSGLNLFGSVIKKLTTRTRKTEEIKNPVNQIVRFDWSKGVKSKSKERENRDENDDDVDEREVSRMSSVWSERDDLNAGSSTSTSMCDDDDVHDVDDDDDDDDMAFANHVEGQNGDFTFCLSPLSPFRFALHKSPSPEFPSPAPAESPACRNLENDVNYAQDSSTRFKVEEDEEDKEQNSPISVLDPPFEDDDEGQGERQSYDLECSYAFVQRAKQQLLHKLRRFEKLAELDPIELEKRMVEDQIYEHDNHEEEEFEMEEEVVRNTDGLFHYVFTESGFCDIQNPGIKRLVSDIILEEESSGNGLNDWEEMVKRVRERLESWKDVESNTIDMMVGMDLRGDVEDWKRPQEQIGHVAMPHGLLQKQGLGGGCTQPYPFRVEETLFPNTPNPKNLAVMKARHP